MSTRTRRVAVVTGASSGIGKEVAKALASQGWYVIGTGRNPARMAAAKAEIVALSRTGEVDMLHADLSILSSARETVRQIAELTDHVDLLVNNAGGMTSELVMTDEGLEANFAGNHLGPFVLTNGLLPLLRAAAQTTIPGSVRILITASNASEMIPSMNLDDLQNLECFNPGLAYCTGKLANVLFAKALAQRLAGDGIVAHSVHPGAVDSNFYSYAPKDTQEHTKDLEKLSEREGADTLVWLACADEASISSGGYWFQRQRRTPNPIADDQVVIDRLWQESERLVNTHSTLS